MLKLIAGLTGPSRGTILYAPGVAIGYAPEHFPKIRFRAEEYLYALGRMRRIPTGGPHVNRHLILLLMKNYVRSHRHFPPLVFLLFGMAMLFAYRPNPVTDSYATSAIV